MADPVDFNLLINQVREALMAANNLAAAEQHGLVTFGGLPVPGATVTAAQSEKKATTVSDSLGAYFFSDLADGVWTIQVQMLGFSTAKGEIAVGPDTGAAKWELKMLPLDQIPAQAQAMTRHAELPPPPKPAPGEPKPPEAGPQVSETEPARDDGLLINGSVNNGASSPFTLGPAFGNGRNGSRGLYNGALGFVAENSALDARPFSLTGQDTPKPGYNHFTGIAYFGGPLKIPHWHKNGPNFFVGYQWTRNRTDSTTPALMPTVDERAGILSQLQTPIIDPLTGLPFPGNVIPQNRLSPQAQALLGFYPLPNFGTAGGYNYQVPIVGVTHQDNLQSRMSQSIDRKNQIYGNFAFQDTRQDTPNVFGFLDKTDTLGLTASVNWAHRFGQRFFSTLGYQFSRYSANVTPNFENRENVSGAAGIAGNAQDPLNWGPPAWPDSQIHSSRLSTMRPMLFLTMLF